MVTRPILYIVLFIASVSVVMGANYWVNNPNNCPSVYQSQDCAEKIVCGYVDPTTYCYNQSNLFPPASAQTSAVQYSGSFGGGYIMDCYANDGTAPRCDNRTGMWCNRDSSCFGVHRLTSCTANLWATFTCDVCVGGYTYCDGSYVDGDGCEVQSGVTNCATGANNNIDATCTCVCDSNYLDCDSSGADTGNGCEVQNGGACTIGIIILLKMLGKR